MPLDIVYLVAEQLDKPSDVLNLALLNSHLCDEHLDTELNPGCKRPAGFAAHNGCPKALKILLQADPSTNKYWFEYIMDEILYDFIHEQENHDTKMALAKVLYSHAPHILQSRWELFEQERDQSHLKRIGGGLSSFKKLVNSLPEPDAVMEEDAKSLEILEQAMCFFQQKMER